MQVKIINPLPVTTADCLELYEFFIFPDDEHESPSVYVVLEIISSGELEIAEIDQEILIPQAELLRADEKVVKVHIVGQEIEPVRVKGRCPPQKSRGASPVNTT